MHLICGLLFSCSCFPREDRAHSRSGPGPVSSGPPLILSFQLRIHIAGADHRSLRVLRWPRNLFSTPKLGFWLPLVPQLSKSAHHSKEQKQLGEPLCAALLPLPCPSQLLSPWPHPAFSPRAWPSPCTVNARVGESARQGASGRCSAPNAALPAAWEVQLLGEHLLFCFGELLLGPSWGPHHRLCPTECPAENKPTKDSNFPEVEMTFSLELFMEIKFPFLLGTLIDPTGMEGGASWDRVSGRGILRLRLLPLQLSSFPGLQPCPPSCCLWPLSS